MSATGHQHPCHSSDDGPKAIHTRMPLYADTAREMPDTIALSARGSPPEEAGASSHQKERVEGAFSRSVMLPAAFDGMRVDAKYVDGIPR
jgi:Hsp20/alpha crystallin family